MSILTAKTPEEELAMRNQIISTLDGIPTGQAALFLADIASSISNQWREQPLDAAVLAAT